MEEFTSPVSATDRREITLVDSGRGSDAVGMSGPFGEVRTILGTIVITDKSTLELAKSVLTVLGSKIEEKSAQEKQTSQAPRGRRVDRSAPDAKQKEEETE